MVLRLGLALLTAAALAVQFDRGLERPEFSAANFLSFFTVQSNIIGVLVLVALALTARRARSRTFESVRGAAVLYLVITGIVFALLLSGVQADLQLTIPWVDTVLHRVMPVAMLADWLIDPPRHRLSRRVVLPWLAFPVAWSAYTLVRGPVVDWYPYPFIDVRVHGYDGVLALGGVLLIGMALAGLLVHELGTRMRARSALAS